MRLKFIPETLDQLQKPYKGKSRYHHDFELQTHDLNMEPLYYFPVVFENLHLPFLSSSLFLKYLFCFKIL